MYPVPGYCSTLEINGSKMLYKININITLIYPTFGYQLKEA